MPRFADAFWPCAGCCQEANEDDVLSAYVPSLEAAYRVASPVVNEIATHWEKYGGQTPALTP
jgi:purine nucleoside permease